MKTYYKLINNDTNEVECYISFDLPVKPEKLLEIIGVKDAFPNYRVEFTTKEKYESETD